MHFSGLFVRHAVCGSLRPTARLTASVFCSQKVFGRCRIFNPVLAGTLALGEYVLALKSDLDQPCEGGAAVPTKHGVRQLSCEHC